MAKKKRTNNDLHNNTEQTKDRATRTPLKKGVKSGAPEGYTYKMSVNICKLYYYYEKKVLTVMVNNSTNINRRITFFHNQL